MRSTRTQERIHEHSLSAFFHSCDGHTPTGTRPGDLRSESVDGLQWPIVVPDPVVAEINQWFRSNARDLPWRRPTATPWQIMVSEFMLQQTPVSRVMEPWQRWVGRWPSPAALAAEPVGEAIRAWGRLGYPRRAARLHAASIIITTDHGGRVPRDISQLHALPGVGDYSAAAIATFAFQQRHTVLDTNVRRVLARLMRGAEFPAPTLTRSERTLADALVPEDPVVASVWAAASMELGALICTASAPGCQLCPVRQHCAWVAAGQPAGDRNRRRQSYEGTDRQCRGALLAVLRSQTAAVHRDDLLQAWPATSQAERALVSLLLDGLVTETEPDLFAL